MRSSNARGESAATPCVGDDQLPPGGNVTWGLGQPPRRRDPTGHRRWRSVDVSDERATEPVTVRARGDSHGGGARREQPQPLVGGGDLRRLPTIFGNGSSTTGHGAGCWRANPRRPRNGATRSGLNSDPALAIGLGGRSTSASADEAIVVRTASRGLIRHRAIPSNSLGNCCVASGFRPVAFRPGEVDIKSTRNLAACY